MLSRLICQERSSFISALIASVVRTKSKKIKASETRAVQDARDVLEKLKEDQKYLHETQLPRCVQHVLRDIGYREVIFIPDILAIYTNFDESQTKEEKLNKRDIQTLPHQGCPFSTTG